MTQEELEAKVIELERRFKDHRHTGIDSQSLDISTPEAEESAVTVYEVTASNVEDTGVTTPVVEFTIPANTIADADVIKVHFVSLFKWEDDDGSATNTVTIKANVDSEEITLHSAAESDDATERVYMAEVTFQRVGSEMYVASNPGSETPFISTPEAMLLKPGAHNGDNAEKFASFDPTIDNDFSITIDFSQTGTVYWRVQSAKAYKI